jgi:hypothetical protein
MIAREAKFYIYCEDEKETEELNKALYGFVKSFAEKNIPVTAKCLTKALNTFRNNIFLINYIKQNR